MRNALITIVCGVFLSGFSCADTLYLDFGDSAMTTTVGGWNNITSTGAGTLSGSLVDSTGAQTTVAR